MTLTVGLLVNPVAGRGRGASYGERARRQLLADGHVVVELSAPDAATARARTVAALSAGEIDVLVVVGGDGMAHLGVDLLAGTDVPLAIVAAGTGNDNARELGLPVREPEAAAALVATGWRRQVDLGRARTTAGDETHHFLGVLGGGFDSVVTQRAQTLRWPSGPRRYDLAVLLELPRFRAIPYVVTVDGHRIETEAMLVAVGNGPSFGGGMHICPDARYDDGLLDVCLVHAVSIPRFLRIYPSVFRGTHTHHPEVEVLRGRSIRLEAAGVVSQADGEAFLPLPIDVDVAPSGLTLLTP
ncbi:diacylglycerol kinase family protein [Dermatophilaceae bacterium Soc4.6]|uniref:diacylglycerol kinase family protein n=1 Tax=Lapillicoccus sp. TaxID=1909287 RepID=UPI0032627E2F